MSFESYYALHYDRFSGADYASYAAFFTEAARRFADMELREALDLGCGAGGLSAALAGMGLDGVGLDVSPKYGAVRLNADGSFSYTSRKGFDVTDTFYVYADYGYGLSDPIAITVHVNP